MTTALTTALTFPPVDGSEVWDRLREAFNRHAESGDALAAEGVFRAMVPGGPDPVIQEIHRPWLAIKFLSKFGRYPSGFDVAAEANRVRIPDAKYSIGEFLAERLGDTTSALAVALSLREDGNERLSLRLGDAILRMKAVEMALPPDASLRIEESGIKRVCLPEGIAWDDAVRVVNMVRRIWGESGTGLVAGVLPDGEKRHSVLPDTRDLLEETDDDGEDWERAYC